ncbi:heavy metal translocating P-type ATPase [bacterium]|nr:heavy metal translocating P-type ATPase [bacterium]
MSCAHCGLPVPKPLIRAEGHSFCCSGCDAVYEILHSENLDDYYRLREEFASAPQKASRISGKDFRYMDDSEFLTRYAIPKAEGRLEIRLYLEGVHCAACTWLVEKVLLEREGAAFAQLDQGRSLLDIVFDPRTTPLSKLARALDRFGYTPHPLIENSAARIQKKESRALLMRMGIAGAVAGNIMLLAAALYAGEYSGIDPEQANLFRWLSLGLSLPAVFYSAQPFFKGAWAGLRMKMLHMDLPISLGILAAFSISVYGTLLQRQEVYYDSVAMLIFLLLAGRMILNRATSRAAEAAESLLDAAPKTVRKEEDGKTEEIRLELAEPDDVLLVLPGEIIAVDGVAVQNGGWVTEAHLTGESAPVYKGDGSNVYSGSIVVQMPLRVKITATGALTRLSQIAEMIRRAGSERAPMVRLHDKIAGYFVGTVLTLATITGILWWNLDPSRWLWNVAALLVVTCPCSLGLATPVAFAIAMGRAAKRGVYLKSAEAIERAAKVRHAVLDKTGTITSGAMEIGSLQFAPGLNAAEQETLLKELAALETFSVHPVATAFRSWARGDMSVEDVRVHAKGIEGTLAGQILCAGSKEFMRDCEILIPEWAQTIQGNVYCARAGQVVAVTMIEDRVSPEAKQAVGELHAMGIELEILSGDRAEEVSRVAEFVGVSAARGGASPEEKLARVRELEARGTKTIVFGDGVNDSAALSAATLGVSAADASEVARGAADVFVSRRGPAALSELLSLSRRTMKTIRLNVVIAVLYNLTGAALAMAGLVSPLLAAVLMPISSLTVLTLAVRGPRV